MRAGVPEANSSSCALPINGPDGVVKGSQPSLPAVPVERASNALAQADAGSVTDFSACPSDIERAALRVEIDAAPVDGRLESQRHAHGFAQRAGDPERPDRQMKPRWCQGRQRVAG